MVFRVSREKQALIRYKNPTSRFQVFEQDVSFMSFIGHDRLSNQIVMYL